jgi:hypothetical protein
VVADNVGIPGAPKYRAYMKEQQGKRWQTIEHETYVEYQTLLKDLVLESEFLSCRSASVEPALNPFAVAFESRIIQAWNS